MTDPKGPAIERATAWLLHHQETSGAWVGEVDLNPGPTAQAVMLHAALRRPFPQHVREKAKRYILRMQNADGGWSPFFGAPSEVSLSAECYVALRLLEVDSASDPCVRARGCINRLGGVRKGNAWTHLYFAVLGVIPWDAIYKTPLEILAMPDSWPVSLRNLSYWVKVITIPMALLGHLGPHTPIAMADSLMVELEINKNSFSIPLDGFFLKYVYPLRRCLTWFGTDLQDKSVKRAWAWIESFTEAHGDFGGNSCTAINVLLIYFRAGKTADPKFEAGLNAMMGYAFEDESEWRLQTCQSHVWDTGLALMALPRASRSRSGEPTQAIERALGWLRDNQITDVYGEWSTRVKAAPGGWCFGDRHKHYPVLDCTAVALLGMLRHEPRTRQEPQALIAVRWLLAMQHPGGGWSSYERYQGMKWINKIFRFKDIEDALVDAPKADVSSKVIEALVAWRGGQLSAEIEPALAKARAFLLDACDTANGLWRGNYGVNYLYGTSFSCRALRAIDNKASSEWAAPSAAFFMRTQNADGGWGESESSYRHIETAGRGSASSPVQTSWALLGLCACLNEAEGPGPSTAILAAISKGVQFLLDTQLDGGIWFEPQFLGTVFPGMVYFRYTYYSAYFPLMALAACQEVGI